MTEAELFFQSLSDSFPHAKTGRMFGALCIKTSKGKAAAMFWKGDLVVKLPETHLKETLSLDGTQHFDPMDGRPMKEWVQVPFHYSDKWKDLLEKSMSYVLSIE